MFCIVQRKKRGVGCSLLLLYYTILLLYIYILAYITRLHCQHPPILWRFSAPTQFLLAVAMALRRFMPIFCGFAGVFTVLT